MYAYLLKCLVSRPIINIVKVTVCNILELTPVGFAGSIPKNGYVRDDINRRKLRESTAWIR